MLPLERSRLSRSTRRCRAPSVTQETCLYPCGGELLNATEDRGRNAPVSWWSGDWCRATARVDPDSKYQCNNLAGSQGSGVHGGFRSAQPQVTKVSLDGTHVRQHLGVVKSDCYLPETGPRGERPSVLPPSEGRFCSDGRCSLHR